MIAVAQIGLVVALEVPLVRAYKSLGPVVVLAAAFTAVGVIHILAHELGHLAAAFLLRIRPASMVVFGGGLVRWRWGGVTYMVGARPRGRNFVGCRPEPTGRAIPLRFIVFCFAGPLVNLLIGAAAYEAARRHGISLLDKDVLLVAAITGGALFVGNIVPTGGSTRLSDGARILRWLFRPTSTRAELRFAVQRERIVQHKAALDSGRMPDLKELRAIVDHGEVRAASLAGVVLLAACARGAGKDFAADEPRLVRVALLHGQDEVVGSALASGLAWVQVLRMLAGYLRTRDQPDPMLLARTAELAELGFRRNADAAG